MRSVANPFEGQFMQPEIYKDRAYIVETTHGTGVVPWKLVGNVKEMDYLEDYLEGAPYDDQELVIKEGYLARMSAPGYLDCTEWSIHDTEEEALAYLEEMYG